RSALMLIADTGPLVAMLNAKDRHHEACTALSRRIRGPIIVPARIVTEVAYFLQIEPGPSVEAAFLDALRELGGVVRKSAPKDGSYRVLDLPHARRGPRLHPRDRRDARAAAVEPRNR
ncbi:MAG: hypothetical protein ACRDNZ_24115, partial [Streptosporangiaceae bacterium]